MKVILTEDIPKVGRAGEEVKVREGFGRNYLLPQKKAIPSNPSNLKLMERQKKIIEAKATLIREEAEAIAEQLAGIEIAVEKESGANDRLFGSVTTMDIAAALREQNVEVDKHRIVLDAPIKNIGNFDIKIKLHPEVEATVKLVVLTKSKE